jgi:subtilisin family serine protease
MSSEPTLNALLRALALALVVGVTVPQPWDDFSAVPAALADDDDDDDDDGRPRRAAPPPVIRDHVPNEVLLINPSEVALERSRSLGFANYMTEMVAGETLTVVHLRLPPGLDAEAALALLRREVPDQISDLNHLYRPQRQQPPTEAPDPQVCRSPRCYGQKLIGWSAALAACGKGVKIGVVDTGVDAAHPSLRGRAITAVSFAAPPARASSASHGTEIVSLLAGNGEGGFAGLLPDAEIAAADVFHRTPGGAMAADAVTIARGLGWLVDRGVSVINMSLAGPENRLVAQAVGYALQRQIAVVAAAGNDGPNAPPRHPAAVPGVVAVTAVDERRRIYRRAASGTHITFAAPGVNVWTAQPRGRYGPSTGTSYATPFVTAVLALAARESGTPGEPEAEEA